MTQSQQRLFELNMPGELAAQWASQRMLQAGLSVQRSFDLQTVRATHPDCPCPHHGTTACTCQFIVLLIYPQTDGAPVTLMVHSQDEHSWFELQDMPVEVQKDDVASQIVEILFAVAPAQGCSCQDDYEEHCHD
ncbi:MAG: hypothetical protein GXP38_08710 [Chloroflexi bacterium]|nr:hypothetical protein [Chloroflexota bacterium]